MYGNHSASTSELLGLQLQTAHEGGLTFSVGQKETLESL